MWGFAARRGRIRPPLPPNEPIAGDWCGDEVAATEHLSVPALARHLMAVLPERTGLLFSATVYRHRLDAPWIIDVTASGLAAGETDDPRIVNDHVTAIASEIDRYNYAHQGRYRFVSLVVMLRACERHTPEPGRVVVRRLHLRPPGLRRTMARLRLFLAGCVL